MSVIVIRHGLSYANNKESLAFASNEAHLMPEGEQQAYNLGLFLKDFYKIDIASKEIAVSEFNRASETAQKAGFVNLTKYSSLNEIDHKMDLLDLRELLDKNELPPAAIDGAKSILENPPIEDIWITHGLVIAGLCKVLNINNNKKLIPRFCEIRELPINIIKK